jgi:hypothetical protein
VEATYLPAMDRLGASTMKSLRLGALTALLALSAYACNDEEDRIPKRGGAGNAGTSAAGSPGTGAAGKAAGGSDGAGGSDALAGSDAAGGNDALGGDSAVGGNAAAGGNDAEGGSDAAGAGGGPALAPLELIGEWSNNFGSDESISASAWNTSRIADYDNDANIVYTQLPADDPYNPDKFTKIVYTEPNADSFYHCWVEFSLDTLEAAKASLASADATDPDAGGCGGAFPWTKATKK